MERVGSLAMPLFLGAWLEGVDRSCVLLEGFVEVIFARKRCKPLDQGCWEGDSGFGIFQQYGI